MTSRGAEFRKCDLQIHSPRDAGWDGARPEDIYIGGEVDSAKIRTARLEYCKKFLAKCSEERLGAIAITDHHEGVFPYLMMEAKAELDRIATPLDLWIFPGMELTCKDACQAIIIFDADLPTMLFEKARSRLGLPADCDIDKPRGIQVELLASNIENLHSLLEDDAELKGRFIVLPHVKPGGHKTVLRVGFHKRFKDMPYVGGYLDRCYPHELNEGDQRILNGEIPAWSSEKRGVISTSDSRYADFRFIGKHASWIKLASPTAESIRQAMLAPDSRIRHEEPKVASLVIRRVKIVGADYVQDDEYDFNPQMNSIIGGRGAGKSSLLEYIRFGLGCSALDGQDAITGDAKATTRMREMLESTLGNKKGCIEVEASLNGAPVTLRRSIETLKFIEVSSEGKNNRIAAEAVAALVPVQSFRQGELSDLAREELATRLLSLVTANASEQLEDIEQQFKRNGQQLSEALAKSVRLTSARQRVAQLGMEIQLAESQGVALRTRLTLAPSQPATSIADHDQFTRQQQQLQEISAGFDKGGQLIVEALDAAIAKLGDQLSSSRPVVGPEVDAIYAAGYGLLRGNGTPGNTDLESIRVTVAKFFQEGAQTLATEGRSWEQKFNTHVQEYDHYRARMVGQSDTLEKLQELSLRIERFRSDLSSAQAEEQQFHLADAELASLMTTKYELQRKLVATVSAQIETIDVKSNHLAEGELSKSWDISEPAAATRVVLDIPLLRDKRIDTLLEGIEMAAEPDREWERLVSEMLALVRWREGADPQSPPPETPMLLSALDASFLDKLRSTISGDRVASALRAVMRPKVVLYQKRDGARIEFRKASQGEQASTLLNILMSQSRGPLLIDQPEEDLDNKIINDIIKTMRSTKEDRQLILSTHNANIVVNGDSELVVEMHLGRRHVAGAIDDLKVRNAITGTMEGGKDAFELRRKKYNF